MGRTTRGPLPARVYWVRRLMVLGVAVLMVVGVAKLLGGSSGGRPDPAARDVAATSPATSAGTPTGLPTSTATGAPAGSGSGGPQNTQSTSPRAMVMPTGRCAPSDVAITPSVPHPVAGRDISLVLDLTSLTTPACSWTLSARTMALQITSGTDLIWTTAQCGRDVPAQQLVLRQSAPTRVRLTWDARRSAPGCPLRTEWALPGTYHLDVAALAGQPQEVTFVLTAPTPAQVTRTAHPHTRHHKKKHAGQPPPG